MTSHGKLCDSIGASLRNDTPEEYVRQNIEYRLVKELGHKPEWITVEFPITIRSATKRADIAIFPRMHLVVIWPNMIKAVDYNYPFKAMRVLGNKALQVAANPLQAMPI